MVGPLRRVIIKRPLHAFRNKATIEAQWKALNYTDRPDLDAAEKEFDAFIRVLEESGAEVLSLPVDDRTGLDSLYTHDPFIITDAGAVIFQTGKVARRGEGPAAGYALRAWGIPVIGAIGGTATAEGGDLLWLDHDTLAAGRGFRTNAAGIDALKRLLGPLGVEVIEFHLPYWSGPGDVLHLQSFISLLDKNLAVVYKRLLPVPLYEILRERKIELIEIREEEFPTQGCNVLALAPRHVVMLERNPQTKKALGAAGCVVQVIKGDEIAFKGSGGPTCLTRPLVRA